MGIRIEQWQAQHLPYLRGLSKPTPEQRLLLELVDSPDRSPAEERQLKAMWRLERATTKAANERLKARRLIEQNKLSERKARTRRLIELGGLVELSGIDQDRGVVLGALLHLVDQLRSKQGADLLPAFKQRGDQLLRQREQERNDNRAARKQPRHSSRKSDEHSSGT